MAQTKNSMPSSGAGLMRFNDEQTSKVTLKPGHVILLTIVVAIIVILLNVYGKALLGL